MSPLTPTQVNKKSRIFIKDTKDDAWHVFDVAQNKNDASIYLFSSEFHLFDWMRIKTVNEELSGFTVSQEKYGHFSCHGSGRTQIRSGKDPYMLAIKGQYLMERNENKISPRHIFTYFGTQPTHEQKTSPALNRVSDKILLWSEPIRPFVLMAFAVPRALEVKFNILFEENDLETVPGVLGVVRFPLVHHSLILIAYRTKFMSEWPKRNLLQYCDGLTVPVFIGSANQTLSVEFRRPHYKLEGDILVITL